jgi:hypothetical protein
MSLAASMPLPVTRPADRQWILSPAADLLLVANLAWPLVALIGMLSWTTGPLTFLQFYVISSAHRLITLPLVFLDRKWIPAQAGRFATVTGLCTLLAAAGLTLGERYPHPADPTNALIYLMIADYVWNAWHFASQTAGIFRIYGRKIEATVDVDAAEREKVCIRVMVLWVILRNIAHLGIDKGTVPAGLGGMAWLDPIAFVPAIWLFVTEIRRYTPERLGRVAYLGSNIALYVAFDASIHLAPGAVLGGIVVAQALFHAIEYITVCGWVAQKKTGGAWDTIVPRLVPSILGFCIAVGAAMWAMLNLWSGFVFGLFTLWVSYLHYSYDGMIWRSPKPARA